MMRLNSNVKWLPGSGMKVSFFSHCDLARCCVCALGTILLNFIAHDDRGQILSEKNSYQHETSCMKIASITIVFFLGEKPWEMWSGKWSKNHQQLCNFSLEFFDHGKVYEKVKRMTKFTATKKKEKKEKLLRLLHSLDVIHKWKCLGNVMQSH